MVREWGEFRVAWREHRLKVAALTENVIHILAACRVPAVLGAETTNLAIDECLVELFLKGSGSE